jgi:hypothetical protein
MYRDYFADRDSLGIVVPGLELDVKQLTIFIERLRDCISKIVRRIVADIDEKASPCAISRGPKFDQQIGTP